MLYHLEGEGGIITYCNGLTVARHTNAERVLVASALETEAGTEAGALARG